MATETIKALMMAGMFGCLQAWLHLPHLRQLLALAWPAGSETYALAPVRIGRKLRKH